MDVQKELYFIAQEALNNVLKHSRASEVHVDLHYAADEVCLEVLDNGVGFDPAQVRPGGMGLEGMRARTRQIEGSLALESLPGEGTKVSVQVPLRKTGTSSRAADEEMEEMDHV